MVQLIYAFMMQVVGWVSISVWDALDENGIYMPDFVSFLLVFGVPLLLGILLISLSPLWFRKDWNKPQNMVVMGGMWGLLSYLFGFIITTLVETNHWLVDQKLELLNGIEYSIFWMALGIIPLAIILLWGGVEWLFWFTKKKKKEAARNMPKTVKAKKAS